MVRSLLFAALLASPVLALADPPAGQIDPTFGSFELNIVGLQMVEFDIGGSLNDYASDMAQDAQGRLLVVGAVDTDEGDCLGLMRFTPDGQLDTTGFGFNPNQVAKGKICHSIPLLGADVGDEFDIATLPDGSFLVGGSVDSHPYVCRFHADGRRMDTFNGSGCVILSQIDYSFFATTPVLMVLDTSLLVVSNNFSGQPIGPVLARISLDTGAIEPFGQDALMPL